MEAGNGEAGEVVDVGGHGGEGYAGGEVWEGADHGCCGGDRGEESGTGFERD